MSDAQIFQFFSVVYIAVGVGMLINNELYKKMFSDFIENSATLYLGGITALAVGFLLVTYHNTWTKDWSVIITIIGWLALIKGILILILPQAMIAVSKAIIQSKSFMKIQAIFVILAGIGLAFLGWCPKSPIPG